MNFGGLDSKYTSFDNAMFVVVPVPYDLTSTYQPGSRKGPSAILDASSFMELYDEELQKETYLLGIHTLNPLESDARGPRKMLGPIRQIISDVIKYKKIPVLLGGEHSITLGAVQALKMKYRGLSVLQLDAHADMRDDYQGSTYSHATVGRRIWEVCPLVQAGVRSMSAQEASFMEKNKVKSFSADFVLNGKKSLEKICESIKGDVYITIDLDVLDPSLMPSTGTPEPGGITWKNLLDLLRRASESCRIRGFDVVELSPIPGLIAPDFLAAKLVYRMMGYISEKH
jgi:agmatinase